MDDKEMLGKVKDVLFDVAVLIDKLTVKNDMESLRRLHYALQAKMRELGINKEYYEKVFFPVAVCKEETKTVKISDGDKGMEGEKKIYALYKAMKGVREEGE